MSCHRLSGGVIPDVMSKEGLSLARENDRGVPPSGGPALMLMHGRPLVYRHHAFWRGRTVAQRAMRSDCVVVMPPTLD